MNQRLHTEPGTLYEHDETAWAELMADLIAARRWDDVEADNLSEYLRDMARRDRREVHSRLATLLTHLLKWEYQPDGRSNSWLASIKEQRKQLQLLLESGTLRNHAVEILPKAYAWAVDQASTETALPEDTFPAECPFTLEQVVEEA